MVKSANGILVSVKSNLPYVIVALAILPPVMAVAPISVPLIVPSKILAELT